MCVCVRYVWYIISWQGTSEQTAVEQIAIYSQFFLLLLLWNKKNPLCLKNLHCASKNSTVPQKTPLCLKNLHCTSQFRPRKLFFYNYSLHKSAAETEFRLQIFEIEKLNCTGSVQDKLVYRWSCIAVWSFVRIVIKQTLIPPATQPPPTPHTRKHESNQPHTIKLTKFLFSTSVRYNSSSNYTESGNRRKGTI